MTGALPDTTRREPPLPSEARAVSKSSYVALGAFALSAALLIPLAWWIPGGAAWLVAAAIVVRSHDAAFRLRMGALLVVVLILAAVPIGTDFSNTNFVRLGAAFSAAVVLPYVWLRRRQPGVIEYTLLPDRWN